MIFSKSFGYAIRGVLYIAVVQNEKRFVQVEEIALNLRAPRHFMGKILKRLAKERVITSAKGPAGGFTINENTLSLPLMRVIEITDGLSSFQTCVLRMKECNAANPCPMHNRMENVKSRLQNSLLSTRLGDLLAGDRAALLKSLSADITPDIVNEKEIYL
jgi:Rrf2 family iron-sulfur cluster assembly transcriptional regulator